VVPKSNRRSIHGRPPRRARRRDARRDAILRAAGGLFRARGVAGAGMRQIAEAADLSPANLYHYFRGKDEILFYCQDRALDRLLDEAGAARRAPGPPARRLEALLAAHVRTLLGDVGGATAHVHTDGLAPGRRAALVAKRDRYERALRRLLDDGRAAGAFDVADEALVARAMLGALNWTVTWFRPDGAHDPGALARALAQYLVRGVVTRPPRRSHG
jgi:AcrR family transcriptional regulator